MCDLESLLSKHLTKTPLQNTLIFLKKLLVLLLQTFRVK